jgi:hypothetical protein
MQQQHAIDSLTHTGAYLKLYLHVFLESLTSTRQNQCKSVSTPFELAFQERQMALKQARCTSCDAWCSTTWTTIPWHMSTGLRFRACLLVLLGCT